MRWRQQLGAAVGLARVRCLGQRVPVAVRLNLNHRCHARCRYCSFPATPVEELPTERWLGIIEELAALGMRRLSLSGGEPMLRRDLGQLIARGAELGVSVSLNTTGLAFAKRREELRSLDLVKFSLDGPPAIHDELRGRRTAFAELEAAIEVCRALDLRFAFAMTLTRRNLDQMGWVIDFAERHGVQVALQPVMAHAHADPETRALYPRPAEWQQAMDRLEAHQRRAPRTVRTSPGAIASLRTWPSWGGLPCVAGEAFLVVEADGSLVPCDRIPYSDPIPSIRYAPVAAALPRLPAVDCAGCGFAGALELNRLMALRTDAAHSILRLVR